MKNITYSVVAELLGISGIAQSSVDVSEDEYVVFYHHDVLGSPVATTDDKGRVLWYEYSQPYGKSMGRKYTDGERFKDNAIEEASSRMGYTGHTVDNTADLVYMKARYYDPVIGRFYSNDPLRFRLGDTASFNRYSYANNNPIRYVDPTGMSTGRTRYDEHADGKLRGDVDNCVQGCSSLADKISGDGDITVKEALEYWNHEMDYPKPPLIQDPKKLRLPWCCINSADLRR